MSVTIRWDFDPAEYPSEEEARELVSAVLDLEIGTADHSPTRFTRAHLAYRRFGFPELDPDRVARAVAEASCRPCRGTGSAPDRLDCRENAEPRKLPVIGYGFNFPSA